MAEAILGILLTVVFYNIGRLVVAVVSLGFARGERWDEKRQFPWYALQFDDSRKLVVSGGLCQLIGGIAFFAGIVALVRWLG